jgi:periplasmic copper chaperone A
MYGNTIRRHRFAMSAVILLNMSVIAAAQEFKVNSIVIEQPWMRATPAGAKVAGGYMTIINTGSEPDRLVGGTLPQAGRFSVHEMKMDGNVMHMGEVQGGLEIKPGQKIEFNPGGYHVMFTQLREPLKQGDTVKGQLRFEKAGSLDIEYRVESVGAQSPGQHADSSHQHNAESSHQHGH